MKLRYLLLMSSMIFCISATNGSAADSSDPNDEKKPVAIAYQPPLRGAPVSRVGGGTRSIQATDLQIEVLAPEHTGLTLQAQPIFYWFCTRAITAPVEFTLVRPGVPEPVLEVTLPGPFEPGIHVVDLSAHGTALAAELDYEWFISVVFDPAQRSNDVTAGAGIRQVGANDPIRKSLPGVAIATGAEYAQAGLWYDAVAALSTTIAQHPEDPTPREQRTELFRQVGLTAVVDAAH